MLILCPECQLQVSDKAFSCPHCGYPLKPDAPRRKISSRRKRLPNGFGQITELKGRNLRKPFRAMITVAKTPEGKPICKLLTPEAYFATYNEAYQALMEYHKDPYKISSSITMKELYERWVATAKCSEGWLNALKTAWRYCSEIYNTEAKQIRARHVRACMENGVIVKKNGECKRASKVTQEAIKTVLSNMLDYAMEYELVSHNYAKDVSMATVAQNDVEVIRHPHKALTDDEMKYLWKNSSDYLYAMILIQCYTGTRPQELVSIKKANVNITDWYMIGGMKTKSGTDRTIPIHQKIRDLVLRFYQQDNGEYLFALTEYRKYYERFKRILPNHNSHDPRKTFVTNAKKCNVDEFAIKRIIGHVISDVTESAYTERDLAWLHSELQKIIM